MKIEILLKWLLVDQAGNQESITGLDFTCLDKILHTQILPDAQQAEKAIGYDLPFLLKFPVFCGIKCVQILCHFEKEGPGWYFAKFRNL